MKFASFLGIVGIVLIELFLMVEPKPLITEFGIKHTLESCSPLSALTHIKNTGYAAKSLHIHGELGVLFTEKS